MDDERPYRRDAFISYSHKQDVPLAAALQRGLHRLARPWTRRQTVNVFRDTTSLAASSDLGGDLLQELGGARYFIYVASPAAAQSRWVREEIEFWIEHRPMDRFLIAVSDGTIAWDPRINDWDWDRTTCLPAVLRRKFAREPLWVDLTAVRAAEQFSLRDAPFRDAVATLLARLRGLSKDAVDSEDLRQRRTAVRVLRGAVTALSVLLVTSLIAGFLAWQQRGEALTQARTSASQALAARALETAASDPRKAAQFALYADSVQRTGESAQALARAVAANDNVTKHFQAGSEVLADYLGSGSNAPTQVTVSADGGTLAYYSAFDSQRRADDERGPLIHLYDIRSGTVLPSITGAHWPPRGGGFALSADGRTLAVETATHNIELWDVRRQERIRSFTASNGLQLANALMGLRAFAFSGDGQRVAAAFYAPDSAGASGTATFHLAVWDTATGRVLSMEPTEADGVALAFDKENRLQVFDKDNRTLRTFAGVPGSWGVPRQVPGLPRADFAYATLSDDGTKAYLQKEPQGGTFEVWDLVKGERVNTGVSALGSPIMPSAAGGTWFAGVGKELVVYDAALRRQRTLGSFSWPVRSLSASADGRWVAAASDDGAVSLFSTTSVQGGTPVPNEQQVKAAELSLDRRTAFRSGGAGTDLWSVTPKGVQPLGRLPVQLAHSSNADESDVVVVSRDGARAVTGQKGHLSVWNLTSGTQVGSPLTAEARVVPLSFAPDDVHVLVATEKVLQVIDTRTWEIHQSVQHAGPIGSYPVVSADRTAVASLVDDGLAVWRWTSDMRLRLVRTAPVERTIYMFPAISVHGEKAAAINADGRISLVDVTTGRTASSTAVQSKGGKSVLFSQDARFVVQVVGSGREASLQFWDSTTGEARGSWALEGQNNGDPSSWSVPDVELLATADGSVLAFGADGSLVRRTTDLSSWRSILCGLVPDPLPASEYDRYLTGMEISPPCTRNVKE
ncbi:hypothetical protein [Streptomyces sp. NPDC090022]|uniref:hypothetical protein n=1 Tax=Streptomyces sp. NPDC090022 TaxID=3365920 RepID=UPI0038260BBB